MLYVARVEMFPREVEFTPFEGIITRSPPRARIRGNFARTQFLLRLGEPWKHREIGLDALPIDVVQTRGDVLTHGQDESAPSLSSYTL